MSTSPLPQVAQLYAIKLLPTDTRAQNRLVGRLEHVSSGRTHDFHSGAALLAFLALEQSRLETFKALLSTVRPSTSERSA